ncbi:MAG: hypothetical protein HXS53_12810 [Theionarchaea archaeon]|nr:hypothetical protein [Theionarchaea archaeon]
MKRTTRAGGTHPLLIMRTLRTYGSAPGNDTRFIHFSFFREKLRSHDGTENETYTEYMIIGHEMRIHTENFTGRNPL